MKNLGEKVYLTFPTTRETAYTLTEIAHMMGITQQELLNNICTDFIKLILSAAEEESSNA